MQTETESQNLFSLNILLAEDDPVNQFAMCRMLEAMNHEITVAKDGKQAIDLLAEHDFDCILMDIQMPVMDGLEATRAVRSSEKLGSKKDIPIIALTAHTMDGDRKKFLEAGMNDYLAKPVTLEDFEKLFKKIFSG